MKGILIVTLLFSIAASAANSKFKCTEVPPKDNLSPGEVYYTIVDSTCAETTDKKSTCTKSYISDYDHCKNPKILMKQFCNKEGLPAEQVISCDCEKGVCKGPQKPVK